MELSRIILFTADMARLTAFYRDVIGLRIVSEEAGWVELAAGACTIALHKGNPKPGSRPPKLVFHAEDVAAARAALVARGAADIGPVKSSPAFAMCDGRDPDGNPFQLSSRARPPAVKSAVPILFVRDVPASAAFFQEKLGFEIDFLHGDPPFYGSVSRDGICLHLRFVHEPTFAELAAREESLILASIEVENVRALHEELMARGAPIAQPLTEQAWGGTDFHVRDLDGNVISFVTYR